MPFAALPPEAVIGYRTRRDSFDRDGAQNYRTTPSPCSCFLPYRRRGWAVNGGGPSPGMVNDASLATGLFATRCVNIAAVVILLYDHALTLGTEVRLIWPAKFTSAKALFLFERYCVPAGMLVYIVQLFSGLYGATFSDEFCRWWMGIAAFVAWAAVASSNFLILLRLWLVWDRNRQLMIWTMFIFIGLQVAGLACAAIVVQEMTPSMAWNTEMQMCTWTVSKVHVAILWVPGMAFDLIMFCITWWNALTKPRPSNTPLATVMYRDGLYFFLILLCLRMINTVLSSTDKHISPGLTFIAMFPVFCLTSLTTCRLVLRLREASEVEHADDEEPEDDYEELERSSSVIHVETVQTVMDRAKIDDKMNSLRPLRSTLFRSLRSPAAATRQLAIRPVTLPILHKRNEASYPGLKPGSESLAHAAQNIREEAAKSGKDIASAIAGVNVPQEGFVGVTGFVASEVPKPVLFFGLAGTIPYLGTGATTVYLAHQASLAVTGQVGQVDPGVAITILDQALNVQVTYGAVMLSFLGALHWGMEFAGFGGHQGYKRLALGAVPVLVAWPTLALDPTMALAAQWAGFTALWWADLKATSLGWTPKWYAQYRFYLSILAGSCILGSLAGITYWGPVGGHGLLDHELELIRDQRSTLAKKAEDASNDEITIVKGEETWTRLRKTEDIERERAEKEGKKPPTNKKEDEPNQEDKQE
uniref:DUF6533 domain-containing protein n=1 Tax=Mycena chlorophos TaxID=658473 RepID=A0ABQ0M5B8_MYCCL|nr:predicted protein [Mycena chlorophos]